MKISEREYNELMSMFSFMESKVDAGYKRETENVLMKYRRKLRDYIDNGYYPDAAHDISRREW